MSSAFSLNAKALLAVSPIPLKASPLAVINVLNKSASVANLVALSVSISSNKPYSSFLNNSEKQSKYNEIIIGLDCDRPKLHSLINSRVDIMIKKGLVDEVNTLIKYKKLNALNTIGYKEIFEYLENKINLEEAIDKIKTNSRRYAKRQLTWFKSNKKVNWYSYDYDLKVILNMIKSFQSIQQST